MKFYIVGSVASGKSTLAERLSEKTGIPCRHLDEVVYTADPSEPWGDRKRPAEERDALFQKILNSRDYIIEDAGRACFLEGMKEADTVLLLDIPLAVRRKRILLRWVRQNLGIEPCIYRPGPGVLKAMYRWAKNYETGADGVKSRIAPSRTKRSCCTATENSAHTFSPSDFPPLFLFLWKTGANPAASHDAAGFAPVFKSVSVRIAYHAFTL